MYDYTGEQLYLASNEDQRRIRKHLIMLEGASRVIEGLNIDTSQPAPESNSQEHKNLFQPKVYYSSTEQQEPVITVPDDTSSITASNPDLYEEAMRKVAEAHGELV
jgi:hypothetical protein